MAETVIGAPPAAVAAHLALKLDPAAIPADGASTSTATVTVTDAGGNPRPTEQVTFSSTDPGEKISSTTNDHNGTYTATITASSTVGPVVITAHDGSLSAHQTLSQTAPPGPSNTSKPYVAPSRSLIVGHELSGHAGSWTPDSGRYDYIWWSCPQYAWPQSPDVAIRYCQRDLSVAGGRYSTYKLRSTDVGDRILLEVHEVLDVGAPVGPSYSAFSGTVRAQRGAPPKNLAQPYVVGSGHPKVGELFVGHAGTWSGKGLHYVYTWWSCPTYPNGRPRAYPPHCDSAQTQTTQLGQVNYRLQPTDVGDRILLEVSAVDSDGRQASASAPTFSGVVQARPGAPKNTAKPYVVGSGQPMVGDWFVGHAGTWSGTGLRFIYTWWSCSTYPDGRVKVYPRYCAFWPVQSSQLQVGYRLQPSDKGNRILLEVTAIDGDGLRSSAYAPTFTGVVRCRPTPPANSCR